MNEYEEAFHEAVLEAMERAKKRAAELTARTAETDIPSRHIRVEARSTREQALPERLPRRST
jgi:hypothetical protein